MDEQNNQSGAAQDSASSSAASPVDVEMIQRAFKRAVDMALKPRTTWETIKGENLTNFEVYTKYFMIVSAVLPVFLFLKIAVIGFPTMIVRVRAPFFGSLFRCVIGYAYLLAFPYATAYITELAASQLELTVNKDSIFKLVAFSMLPAFLCGVLFLFTMDAGSLFNLVLLYGLYILYLGIPLFTEVPEGKRLHLLGLIAGVGAVLQLVVSLVGII